MMIAENNNDLICPLLSCRLIGKNNEPIIAKCQKERCSIWDNDNKCCAFLSIKMEITRSLEK